MNKLLPLLAFSILLLVPVGAHNAFAHGTIDQINSGPSTGSHTIHFVSLPFGAEIQTFQPSVSPLAGFDIELVNPTTNAVVLPALTWTISTSIISGNIAQGTVNNINFPAGPNAAITVHIDLPAAVLVIPGDQYFLQIGTNAGSFPPTVIEWAHTGDNYPNGFAAPDSVATGSIDFIFTTYTSSTTAPLSCGPKTIVNAQNQCVPDLNQICGSGTIIQNMMCVAQSMGSMIGGTLLEINTLSLLVGAIGVNPIITGLVGITLAGIVGQTAWFVHRRRKSIK